MTSVSFVLQSVGISLAVVVSLIKTDALPASAIGSILVAPAAPRGPSRPQAQPIQKPITKPAPKAWCPLCAPRLIPKTPPLILDEPEARLESNDTSSDRFGVPGGVPCGQPGQPACPPASQFIPQPPPPPTVASPKLEKKKEEVSRLNVGGKVQAAKLQFAPRPQYPPLAKQAGVQGVVRLSAVISRDGRIQQLTVQSGHPLLVQAALEAVRQWRYQPTELNDLPVEVATQIDVNFTLTR